MEFDYAQYERDVVKAREEKKAKMYKALADNYPTITNIEVEYDGSGDEGNIDSPICYEKDDKLVTVSADMHALIESYVSDVLEEHQEGWEINDGSYGTAIIDVAAQTTHFDHYERYTDSESLPFDA